jgi:uncharacterized RDD family membrane protein YckC
VKLLAAPCYAGFWRRAAAGFFDSVVYFLLVGLLLGPEYVNAETFTFEGLVTDGLMLLITVAMWRRFLGTPGKLLMGCQVVDADSFEPVTLKQGVMRYLGYFVSMLPLMLGFLWIAWDPRKQGFHDKLAHTVVLYNAGIERDDESAKSLPQLLSEVR